MSKNKNTAVELPEELDKKLKDFINSVYLYCEENEIKKDLVQVEVSNGYLNVYISESVEEVHIDRLEAMSQEFENIVEEYGRQV